MPLIDEAKDKASAFQEQGPVQGNQDGATQFLNGATESLKNQGRQESAFGIDQGSPSDFGVNTTKATDKDAPAPSMNAANTEADPGPDNGGGGNGLRVKDIDLDWESTTNAGNDRNVGGKKGKFGVFGAADLQSLRDDGYNDKQISRYLDKNVGYGQIKGNVVKDLDYQYKGDKVALEDYDHTTTGNNNSFGTGNLRELKAMGYSDKQIEKHMQGLAGEDNESIGEIGGGVQRKTGFGVRTDFNKDNIGDYDANEIGRTWQEDNGRDDYGRNEMRALAKYNDDLSKEDVANEFLKRQSDSLKEGYEGNPFKTNKKGQAWMDKYGTYDPDSPDEADPGPEDPVDPIDPVDPTPDDPTPTPDPTPAPAPSPAPSPTPPQYGSVTGNPYNSGNQGYYYGTDNASENERRYQVISNNAADAHARGLEDIATWQNYSQDRENYRSQIMDNLYQSMGLKGGNN